MCFNPFSLKDKVILITGASSGIGRQCAIDCSKMGAKIALVGRNGQRLNEVLSIIGEGSYAFLYDLSNFSCIQSLVEDVVCKMGKIDGFIHAAGIEVTKPVKLLQPNEYQEIIGINTLCAAEFVKQFSNIKYFNRSGSIIFISSITALIARGGLAAYAASKGALISMARIMALEMAKKNIRVNCISPGTILTPLMQNYLSSLTKEEYAKRIDGFPLGLGQTTDISNACIFLLSDAARWITGQNIVVDGGYTMT